MDKMAKLAKQVVLESLRRGQFTSGDDCYSALVRAAVRYMKTMERDTWNKIEEKWFRPHRIPCPTCNGTGFVHNSCCRTCEGTMSINR
jgi:RecJ-like exonuclease